MLINMPEADIIEIHEDDGIFNEQEWIGIGKRECTDLPNFVKAAREASRVAPDSVLKMVHLPGPDVMVADFVAWELPRVSSEIILTKPDTWFSKNTPSIDIQVLLSQPVPSGEFVKRLDIAYRQAWLDGARSISDHRFNDGTDHLPLWVIPLWQKVVTTKDMQLTWGKALTWLDLEERRQKREEGRIGVQKAREILQSTVGWNKKMKYCSGMTTTYHLSRFLGTLWLSDDHISMMVEELNCDLDASASSDICLASFAFTVEIDNIRLKLALPSSARKKTVISKYENSVKNGSLRQLYFPLHINATHWIAGVIDFKKKTISFGACRWFFTYIY